MPDHAYPWVAATGGLIALYLLCALSRWVGRRSGRRP